MSNWLQKFGAQSPKPVRYGVIWQNRLATGIWTQRSPLRDAASTRIEEEFYGARGDALIDGLNCEVSTKLTFIRRPGSSVYNSQSFPPINRFYGFNPVINNQEQIHVIADVSAQSGTPVILNISSVEVVSYTRGHSTVYFTVVTFTTAPPTWYGYGQEYTFSGLTTFTSLNGQSLVVNNPSQASLYGITLTANQAYFASGGASYSNTSDTGTASVYPPSALAGPTVRDVTGPSTNKILWSKLSGSSITSFLGVGNTLYASDGVSAHKFTESSIIWTARTQYSTGQFIVDPNGNIQLNIGSQIATISNIQITGGTCTLFFSPGTSLTVPVGTEVSLSGLTTVPSLNGTTQTVTGTSNSQQIQFANAGTQSYATETGQVTTGTGVNGSSAPTWLTTLGAVTQDGGAQWINSGPQVETWGIVAPTQAPTVTQTAAPSAYSSWAPNTWYAPLFVVLDGNGNLQQLTSVGSSPHQTGGSTPTWSVITGGTTADGNVTWTCLGTGAWIANHTYAVGAVVQATFTYYITESYQSGTDQDGNPIYTTYQQPVTADCLFECTIAGTSGTSTPGWTNGLGTITGDNTVVWTNQSGPTIPPWPGSTQILSLATAILDTNNNVQNVQVLGESGGSAPTWQTPVGSYTGDNTTYWLNSGPYGSGNTGAWIYAYSFENSVTDTISTASPESAPIIVKAGNLAVIQGAGSTDPQVDNIVIWRTVQGGSQLFYLDTIPNPGTTSNAGTWIYTDTTPDTSLNEFIEAPIDGVNNPPPVGLTALAYHLERIWGAVNNLVYFSTGPDVTAGNGNEAWSASNVFAFPDTVIRLFPTSSGLFVFTTADIFIIQGLGTTSSPLFSTPLVYAFGLASYDAFSVNGTIVYAYTSDNQVVSLDPNAGITEIGFPIGDQLGPNNGTGTFLPANTQVTWHSAQSQDKGLYVSDFAGTWWRLCPTPSPEQGWTWSPKAQIVGGFSAVQSVETIPGIRNLLMGPQVYGPILTRNYNVYSDNGSAYPSYAVLGSLVLAQPGQLAHVPFITTDSVAIGAMPTLAVQIDEIAPLSAGYFESLTASVPDPTQLSPSNSVYAQRFYLSQTQKPAVCRHMQIQINWGSTDTVRNELLSLTVYGGFSQEN